jgi:hypothetical protein
VWIRLDGCDLLRLDTGCALPPLRVYAFVCVHALSQLQITVASDAHKRRHALLATCPARTAFIRNPYGCCASPAAPPS